MQRTKKFLSLLIAIVLTLSITIPAFAEGTTAENTKTYSITIRNNTAGHTYEAYQIFSGDIHGKVLSNVVWASGQTTHNVGDDATEAAEALKTEADTEALINGLTLGTPAESTSTLNADGTYVISGLAPGYYLIKDKDNSLIDQATDKDGNPVTDKDGNPVYIPRYDAYTDFIVKIVGDATANPKSAKPTLDKQILDEENDADQLAVDGWGETADHALNESFKNKLIANIPNTTDLNGYSAYKLEFHDQMSEGITFESIESVKVTAADGTVTDIVKKDDANPNGYECDATPNQPGDSWILTIADLMKIIDDIKGAKVEIIYTAHMNNDAQLGGEVGNVNKAYLVYSNNPNNTADMGKTADDWTWAYTITVDNKKIDGDTGEALAGAGFRLYSKAEDGTETEVALVYDAAKDAYRPVAAGETGEELKSAALTGNFNVVGIDSGEYILKETTVPGGYNKCKDINITITATHAELQTNPYMSSCIITRTQEGVNTPGIVVENNKGAVLPETGGMGTVIFYVAGGVLVAAAVVLIITRKRMSVEK